MGQRVGRRRVRVWVLLGRGVVDGEVGEGDGCEEGVEEGEGEEGEGTCRQPQV